MSLANMNNAITIFILWCLAKN